MVGCGCGVDVVNLYLERVIVSMVYGLVTITMREGNVVCGPVTNLVNFEQPHSGHLPPVEGLVWPISKIWPNFC